MQRLWLSPVGTVPLLLCAGDWGVLQPTASGDLKSANHRVARTQTPQDPQKQWDVRAALASIHTEAAFVSPELRGPRPPSGRWFVFLRSLLSNDFFIRVKAPEFQG